MKKCRNCGSPFEGGPRKVYCARSCASTYSSRVLRERQLAKARAATPLGRRLAELKAAEEAGERPVGARRERGIRASPLPEHSVWSIL